MNQKLWVECTSFFTDWWGRCLNDLGLFHESVKKEEQKNRIKARTLISRLINRVCCISIDSLSYLNHGPRPPRKLTPTYGVGAAVFVC
jgi:hypothetical protein